jgi:hypothetical protein
VDETLATRDGKQIAFEIETGKSNSLANVQKYLDTGVNEVFIVATSNKVKINLETMLQSRAGIRVVPGNEMIKLLNT